MGGTSNHQLRTQRYTPQGPCVTSTLRKHYPRVPCLSTSVLRLGSKNFLFWASSASASSSSSFADVTTVSEGCNLKGGTFGVCLITSGSHAEQRCRTNTWGSLFARAESQRTRCTQPHGPLALAHSFPSSDDAVRGVSGPTARQPRRVDVECQCSGGSGSARVPRLAVAVAKQWPGCLDLGGGTSMPLGAVIVNHHSAAVYWSACYSLKSFCQHVVSAFTQNLAPLAAKADYV